jgi:type VI secretion system protein ImpM
MRCSLFGKLGAKRDFVALATPRRFLETWEPWVQACMSASRHQLGAEWQNAFLTAPVWRFWLGADISGATVVGAIMPSLDGIGRYYPLTLLVVTDPLHSIPPPDFDAQDPWFAAAEEFLLATLDQARSFEDISAALDAMPLPLAEASIVSSPEIVAIDDKLAGIVTAGKAFQESFLTLRQSNHGTSAAASFWWTEGGENFPPMALGSRGMPDPFRYSIMLTGNLAGDKVVSAS